MLRFSELKDPVIWLPIMVSVDYVAGIICWVLEWLQLVPKGTFAPIVLYLFIGTIAFSPVVFVLIERQRRAELQRAKARNSGG